MVSWQVFSLAFSLYVVFFSAYRYNKKGRMGVPMEKKRVIWLSLNAKYSHTSLAIRGCLTPKNPKSLTGLIFLRKFMFFVLRNSVIYSIIEV